METNKDVIKSTFNANYGIINELLKLDDRDVKVEIIGCFIWVRVQNNPMQYIPKLQALQFMYSRRKDAWGFTPGYYPKRTPNEYDFDDIRKFYGTSGVIRKQG